MAKSVFKSEQGRQEIVSCYEKILDREASAFPHSRRIVETAIGSTHVIEAGKADKPPLLLLHGTASNSATWLADIPLWSRHFRVIAADILGEPGKSEDRRLTLASEESSVWLGSLLDALGLTHVRIVGMSLGGWMGLHFATRFPQRVEALSLIVASGLAPQKLSFIFIALPLAMLGNWGRGQINKLVCAGAEIPAEAEEFMRRVGRHFRPLLEPVPVFSDEELVRLQMPVQFFAGAKDMLIRSKASTQRLEKLLPHAEVHLLQDCGHVILGKGNEILHFLLRSDRAASEGRKQASK
jgi:pimeloyl-ACP methyl ester carboxylesterase